MLQGPTWLGILPPDLYRTLHTLMLELKVTYLKMSLGFTVCKLLTVEAEYQEHLLFMSVMKGMYSQYCLNILRGFYIQKYA